MFTGSQQVVKETSILNKITQEITNGMNEMATGAEQVTVAVNKVNELSEENRISIDELVNEVGKFKVDWYGKDYQSSYRILCDIKEKGRGYVKYKGDFCE